MKKYFTIILFGALFLGGCDEHLTLEPVSYITSEAFFNTEDDVDGALNGLYIKLVNEAVYNLFIWGELRSDIFEVTTVGGSLNTEIYYDHLIDTDRPGPEWDGLYSLINASNLVLKYTPDIEFSNEAKKNNALGQAYAMRAFAYFTLARTWGDAIIRTEPMESYDPMTIQLPRSPVAEVFALIKSDLDEALKLFEDNSFPDGRNKWSQPAANALKADVYLWTGKRLNGGDADFTIALNALNAVQGSDVELRQDYADIFKYENKGNKEIVMAIGFKLNESPNQKFAKYGWIQTVGLPNYIPQWQHDIIGDYPEPSSYNVYVMTPEVRNQFTDDDTRKASTYLDLEGSEPGQYWTNFGLKFTGTSEYGSRYFVSDYILYRYGDLLLMKAEAKNALGQDPTTEINMVRQRAYGANAGSHTFVNGSKAQNDATILQERLFELAHEGKRWWDLVRFDKAYELCEALNGRESETYLMVWPVGRNLLSKEVLVEETTGY